MICYSARQNKPFRAHWVGSIRSNRSTTNIIISTQLAIIDLSVKINQQSF